MAQVPLYDSPQVEPRATPGYRQESVATPELLAGAQKSGAALAEGALGFGGEMAKIAANMQEREDITAVLGVEAARKEKAIQYDKDTRENRQGSKAAGLTLDTKDWWEQAAKEDFAALKTDKQRELYRRRMSASRNQHLATSAQFETNQGEVAMDQSSKAAVVAATNSAAADPSESNVAIQIDAIKTNNTAMAKRKGWAEGKDGKPGVLDVVNGEDITRLHQQVIESLVATNKDAAAAYFEKHKDEIDGSKRDQIGESAKKATAEAQGRQAAGEVWNTIGYAGGIDKMADALRDKFKNNTYALSAAEADLKNRVSMFEHGEKSRTEGLMAKLNIAAAQGASIPALRGMPEFNQVLTSGPTGEKAIAGFLLHQESLEATRASRAASYAARGAANEQRQEAAERRAQYRLTREGLNDYITLMMNPDRIAAMTPDQVVNLRTTIGDENTLRIQQEHNRVLHSADALRNANVDADVMKGIIQGLGFDPEAKDRSDDDLRRITKLTNAIKDGIYAAAQRKGKPLNRQEMQAEAQKVADDTVRVPGFFSTDRFGVGFGTGTNIPASALLTPDEMAKAVVRTPSGVVKLSEIPAEYTLLATQQLRAAGVQPTQRAIAEAWTKDKSRWMLENRAPVKPITQGK